MSTTRPKLMVVVTHPIQHFAPVYQAMARAGRLDPLVVYLTDAGALPYFDGAFQQTLAWDVDLLSGYRSVVLRPGLGRVPKGVQAYSWRLQRLIEEEDPAAILVYGYTRAMNWTAWRWARRRRRKLLYCSDSVLNGRGGWRQAVHKTVVRLFFGSVETFLAAGDCNEDYLLHHGVERSRIIRCPLPVDVSRMRREGNANSARAKCRRLLDLRDDDFVVLQCGKLQPTKRPLDLVEATLALREKGVPVVALFAGAGELRDAIARRAAGSEYMEAIRLVGFVNQSQLHRYYASADALVIASATDAHPLVATEAAALGLPLIVSDRVGCIGPRDVAQRENSLTYPCGDVRQLAGAIEALWRDPVKRLQMGAASEAIALDQDVEVVAEVIASAVLSRAAGGSRRSEEA